MIGYLRRLTIRNIVSPYGLAIISFIMFVMAWAFPPSLYTEYVREPNLMYLDPVSFIYFCACILAFTGGCRFYSYFASANNERDIRMSSSLICFGIPMTISTIFSVVYLAKVGAHINFISLLTSAQGNAIKIANQVGQLEEGIWGRSPLVVTAVVWWSLYRYKQLKPKGTTRILFWLLFTVAVSVDILTCMATVNRTNLLPVLAGIGIIMMFGSIRGGNVKLSRIFGIGFAAAAGIIMLFLSLSFARGDTSIRLLVMGLLGYSLVSYNRMAAMLSGVLQFGYAGKGVYLFPFLLESYSLNNVFDYTHAWAWPNPIELWQSEFTGVASIGLNPAFNWVGLFGYIYSDLRWFALFYIAFLGILAAYLWKLFQNGRVMGIVMYPWMGFSILFWFGYNVMFDARVIAVAETGIALLMWEKLFVHTKKRDTF